MCGLTGLYTFNPRPDRANLHNVATRMNNALITRGPDNGDIWQDPDLPLILGHRRLSIIDISESGHQPMESSSSRYIITYNGEIYNFKSLRMELEQDFKIKFRGNSDTETLLHAIEHWGIEVALSKINGMFAFALWDRKAKALYFARDRMGKKPLYIGWAGSTLVFGSELKSLCAHPDFRRDIDRASLTSYMRFGYVPAPLCIYQQVWQLPAGSMIALDLRMLRSGQDLKPFIESYWSHKDALITARQNPVENPDNAINEFEELLTTCVQERMISDVPLGAFLSGGIDSSSIVALMQKNSSEPIKTYSIGFKEAGFNEAEYAKEIASHLGTDHHELYVEAKDSLSVVEKMPIMFDEPFADTSAIPTYLISKFARESVTVALSGDGGDEMLGGYNRHISAPKAWNTVNNIPANLRKPLGQIITSISPSLWDKLRPSRPQFGAHMHKFAGILDKTGESDVYLSLVSHWKTPKTFVQDGKESVIPLVDPDLHIDDLNFPETMMYWDTISYLSGDILTKVDRASMAVSLEARAPLLDTRIYDYVWRLPMDVKIRGGQGKWLLRQVLHKHVPESLFDRPKQGFSVPIAEWLRGDLKDWAQELLNEDRLRKQGLLNYLIIGNLWEEHQKGRGNHAQKLWTVLMFQAWHKEWIEE